MWWLPAEALKSGESPVGLDASIAEAGVPLSHPRARLISATLASPALKVRAFIVCSSFCVFVLLLPFTQCQQGSSGAQAEHGLRSGGNACAIYWGLGAGREQVEIPTPVWSRREGSLHGALLSRLETSKQ
jgi:hypothetical protein